MEVVLGLIIGLILAGLGVWLIMRSQIQGIKSQKQASDEKVNLYSSQREMLSQENRDKTTKIEALEESLAEKQREILSIIRKSSEADAKIGQISDLEEKLNIEVHKYQSLQLEITSQKESISRLTTELANKEQYSQQKIDDLRNILQQANSENDRYREEIELANQKSAEAQAQKEQIHQLKEALENKNRENHSLQSEIINLKEELSSLQTKLIEEQKSTQEKLDLLQNAQQNLTDTFKALSSDVLQNNKQQFLEEAKATFENIYQISQQKIDEKQQKIDNLVLPLSKSLEAFDKKLSETDNAWSRDKGQISEQLQSQVILMSKLKSETSNLTKALRQPVVRGRWGEVQLKRVVEMSGMQEHCDFLIQETVNTEDGSLRPDLVVTLPHRKKVIVDSKAPLKAYLEALETEEESKQIEYLKNHSRHIRNHIIQLSSKNYWEQFEYTPEFVIMFLPGEVFFSAALQKDPTLIEFGIEKKVILASPTNLITLLKTIEYCWRQEKVAENAQEIGNLGRELFDRFTKFSEHLITVRKKLDDTVNAYNKAIGSYESRLLVTARKFQEIGSYGNDEIESINPIDKSVKLIRQEYNSTNGKQ